VKRSRRLPNGPGRFETGDGLSLWYRVAGRGPAVLVPSTGWGSSVDMSMKSLIPLQKHFSLIYLDTRGSGRSDAPAKASGWRFRNFVNDLETLREHLHIDRWIISPHSDACLQGLAYAIEHPRACHGLIIVGGTLHNDDKELRADIRARMKKLSHEPWFAAATNADPQSDEEFKKSFLDVQLPLYFASYEAARKARHYFSASTYRIKGNKYDAYAPRFTPQKLAKVRVPTAIFEGDSDVVTTPLEAIRLQRGIPNATLFMIRNAGHFPWLEQRKTFFAEFTEAARMILKPRR
jgi:proline iminopeptidase